MSEGCEVGIAGALPDGRFRDEDGIEGMDSSAGWTGLFFDTARSAVGTFRGLVSGRPEGYGYSQLPVEMSSRSAV